MSYIRYVDINVDFGEKEVFYILKYHFDRKVENINIRVILYEVYN